MHDPDSDLHAFPTFADVERARARIRGRLEPTPLVPSRAAPGRLKLENLQVTGAYKVRGALNATLAQIERGDHRPLFAASAGNHALGVAWAAREAGLAACVVVPRGAPTTKLSGARALGAEVLVQGDSFEEALAVARELAAHRGGRFIHAFDDPEVIAGQGTVGLELLAHRPDVVLVPVGGGGLISGIGLVLHARGVRVVGVQVAGLDAMRRSLAGLPPLLGLPPTLADGVRVREPGRLTRAICERVVSEIVTVTEEEVRAAVLALAVRDKIVAEGAGAVAVAALSKVGGERPVAIVSGGNIDFATLGALAPYGPASTPSSLGDPEPPAPSLA